jgi:hypothetical protein
MPNHQQLIPEQDIEMDDAQKLDFDLEKCFSWTINHQALIIGPLIPRNPRALIRTSSSSNGNGTGLPQNTPLVSFFHIPSLLRLVIPP